jgi:hypothetical protein
MSYDVDSSVTISIMAARPTQPVTIVCKVIPFGRNTLHGRLMYDDQGVQKKELKIDNGPTDITKVNDLTVAVATWTAALDLLNKLSSSM